MGDERLRELERRWLLTGTVADEAAFLRERVKCGELTQASLDLAAFCGHPAALQAKSRHIPEARTLDVWLRGLAGRNEHAALYAAIRLAESVLHIWTAYHAADPRPRAALEAARAVLRGSPGADRLVGPAADEANDAAVETLRDPNRAAFAASCASSVADYATSHGVGDLLGVHESLVEALGPAANHIALLETVASETAAWVLGRHL